MNAKHQMEDLLRLPINDQTNQKLKILTQRGLCNYLYDILTNFRGRVSEKVVLRAQDLIDILPRDNYQVYTVEGTVVFDSDDRKIVVTEDYYLYSDVISYLSIDSLPYLHRIMYLRSYPRNFSS